VTWFVSIAVALVVVALLWLLPTLLRRHGSSADGATVASNLTILKDQLAELDGDLANGAISPQQYQQAREDLERRALEDARDATAPGAAASPATRRTALALAIAIPLCAGLFYFQLGSPDAISWHAMTAEGGNVTPKEVEAMVARLATRLEKAPDDGNGWALLGRSYLVMQRYPEAVAAYARAAALVTDDADLYADYADALAMNQGRRIDGKVLQLVDRALQIDPAHWKALAIAGSAAFENKDYRKAIGYWQKLLPRAEPDSEFARSIAANIEEARKLGGIKPSVANAQPAQNAAASGGASVRGTVRLSGALAGKADPSDTVFIFARALQGPRMPLAIVRRQVKDLPYTFSLDDSQAMAPEMKLSNFPEVVIGARISKSANATPQSGDLQGVKQPVKIGASNVAVVIDSVVP
jgi:cytochrome c-type biogenesis protein CcmH